VTQVIWKFPVDPVDAFELTLPPDARVLCVQMQRQNAQLWIQLDPNAPTRARKFFVRPTGVEWDETSPSRYVGTFQPMNGLVFHLYEDVTS
jgi:hypothetical protein